MNPTVTVDFVPRGKVYCDDMSELLRPSQVSAETGASPKALRGYEENGLISPIRASNGYRLYDEHQVRVAGHIRSLNRIGIPLRDMAPFVDCLNAGSEHADACPSSLAEYRHAIDRIDRIDRTDRTISELSEQRRALVSNLSTASRRLVGQMHDADAASPNLAPLPSDLVAPFDDGRTDGLPGLRMPSLLLPSTDGNRIDLGALGNGRTLLYVFPMTGAPEVDMPQGWDAIPGARGCSPHNCDMRNHYADMMQSGVSRVFGLSSQPLEYQSALAETLRLPYPLLTDEALELATVLRLPTICAGDLTVYQRLAMIVNDGVIEHVFFPIFPPDQHARVVLDWLEEHMEV